MGKVETVKPGKPPQGAQGEEVNSKSKEKRIKIQASSSLEEDTWPVLETQEASNFGFDANNGSYIE